jgi:predicted MPP superfamily phosphohydrolase
MHLNATILPGIVAAIIGLTVLLAFAQRVRRLGATWPRRRRIVNGAVFILLALVWAAGVYAWLIEPRMLVVRLVEVVSEHWAGAPLTIGVIADTHVPGPHMDAARVARVVDALNRHEPDIVVLLGDYVGEGARRVDRSARVCAAMRAGIAEFAELEAPLGVVGVLGNRDRTFDRAAVIQALSAAGILVVHGASTTISRPGGAFAIVGLTGEVHGREDVRAAFAAAPAGDRIVISHSPEPFPDLPRDVPLMLAAHTHCGQVSIPFFGRPVTHIRDARRYACHRFDANGRTLYTTAGVGTSGLPVRFLNPPEIVVVTIRQRTAGLQTRLFGAVNAKKCGSEDPRSVVLATLRRLRPSRTARAASSCARAWRRCRVRRAIAA